MIQQGLHELLVKGCCFLLLKLLMLWTTIDGFPWEPALVSTLTAKLIAPPISYISSILVFFKSSVDSVFRKSVREAIVMIEVSYSSKLNSQNPTYSNLKIWQQQIFWVYISWSECRLFQPFKYWLLQICTYFNSNFLFDSFLFHTFWKKIQKPLT